LALTVIGILLCPLLWCIGPRLSWQGCWWLVGLPSGSRGMWWSSVVCQPWLWMLDYVI